MKLLSSVVKTLRVLESFSPDHQELSTMELSRMLAMDKSSVSRIVATLHHHGYLSRNAHTSKYRLGAKLVALGNCVLDRYDRLDLGEIAAPFLRSLADEIKEVVHLGILDGMEVVTLQKVTGGQMVTVDTRVGGRYPAHACALGKVLLSGLPEAQILELTNSRVLQRRTPRTIVEVSSLVKEIEQVRRQGYAFEYEESFVGICCVAAPVRDYKGSVIAALSATVPKQRAERRRLREILRYVKQTGELISRQINGESEAHSGGDGKDSAETTRR